MAKEIVSVLAIETMRIRTIAEINRSEMVSHVASHFPICSTLRKYVHTFLEPRQKSHPKSNPRSLLPRSVSSFSGLARERGRETCRLSKLGATMSRITRIGNHAFCFRSIEYVSKT